MRDGLSDLHVGSAVILLTWFDRASRNALVVHPRGDPANPATGVFNTRSPNRPNPIGLHHVEITAIEGLRVQVRNLEWLDVAGQEVDDARQRSLDNGVRLDSSDRMRTW